MNGGWLTAIPAILSFLGAILGSLITGYLVENYRQKNRLQLTAIDKRLEAYQAGYRWIFEIDACLSPLYSPTPDTPSHDEAVAEYKRHLKTTRLEAHQWLKENYLYLGEEAGQALSVAFGSTDYLQLYEARKVIEREAGLPGLNKNWRSFIFGKNKR